MNANKEKGERFSYNEHKRFTFALLKLKGTIRIKVLSLLLIHLRSKMTSMFN
jgi:hypothetical protein